MQCCAQVSPDGVCARWIPSELMIKSPCVVVAAGGECGGSVGLLRNRAGCGSQLQPRDTFGEQEQCVHPLQSHWRVGADLAFRETHALGRRCNVGVHFCFLNSGVSSTLTKSKCVHYSWQKCQKYFSIT